jgi:hypothetical protein
MDICVSRMEKYKCEHGKRKYDCKECCGSSFCEHGKSKQKCKSCGGSQICEHGRQKFQCKSCGGSQICEHGRQKSKCKSCGGSQICEHGIQKSFCIDCKGSQICEHGKRKSQCIDCGGTQICEHRKQKSHCIDCGGTQICEHKKYRKYCIDCGGLKLCKTHMCETVVNNTKYKGYCIYCFIHLFPDEKNVYNYKTKENEVVSKILQNFSNFTWVADKKVKDGCSKRRPDLLLDLGSHIIIVEVDENKHTDYDCSCERKRLMELSQDLHHRPIVFIRFNPDSYTNEEGIEVKSCWKMNKMGVMQITKHKEWEERIESLKKQIQYWIDNTTEKTVEIIELFY